MEKENDESILFICEKLKSIECECIDITSDADASSISSSDVIDVSSSSNDCDSTVPTPIDLVSDEECRGKS